jgi:hypothetical protein
MTLVHVKTHAPRPDQSPYAGHPYDGNPYASGRQAPVQYVPNGYGPAPRAQYAPAPQAQAPYAGFAPAQQAWDLDEPTVRTARPRAVRSVMTAGRATTIVLGTWFAAMAFTLFIAAETRIGPVVLTFTKTHGAHLGDIYTALISGGIAVVVTAWVLATYSRGRRG